MKKILLTALLIVLGAFWARIFILDLNLRNESKEKQKQEIKINPEEESRQIIKMTNEVFLKKPFYDRYNIGEIIVMNLNNNTLYLSTAFLVDKKRGIIATAAHSVTNIGPGAPEIHAKFGNKLYQTILYKELINKKEDVALLFLQDYNKDDFIEVRNFGVYQNDNIFVFVTGYSKCLYDSEKFCAAFRLGKIVTGYHEKINKDIYKIMPSFGEMRRYKIFLPPNYCTNLDIFLKMMKELNKIDFSIRLENRIYIYAFNDNNCGPVIDYKFKFLPGMSGAPIFNKFGEIIGVSIIASRDDGGLLLATPISEIKTLLIKAKKIHRKTK